VASSALDREAIDAAVSRGSDLLKQGKLDDAQKAFRAALLLDGENPRILALLGLTHFRAGQFPQARPIYEELVERAPTDASHRLNLGLVYLKLGDSDKAIGSLEASRSLDPSQGRAISYLGLAYARAGRYAEAYRSFLMAGQSDLATEIEINLTASERDSILAQIKNGDAPRKPAEPPKRPTPNPQVSMPEIVIERGALSGPTSNMQTASSANARSQYSSPELGLFNAVGNTPPPPVTAADLQSSAAIVIDRPPVQSSIAIPVPMSDTSVTDSMQFVLPKEEAIPEPAEGQSVISRAVEIATPANTAAPGQKVGWGSTPPIPLSQLATEQLVRPDDGDSPFEVTATGALVVRVVERILTRLDGVHITGGALEFEPAMRRSRGRDTDESFNYGGGSQMHGVSGEGYLIAVPNERKFTAVTLDDDILYLREDLVFAFETSLRWENGNVPGLRGKLPVVQFRGDGAVALRSSQPLVRVKLPAQGVVCVDASRLAGWIGRVIPRAVVPPADGPMGEICVECTGEGVVLIDPGSVAPPVIEKAVRAARTTPPPPPKSSAAAHEEDEESSEPVGEKDASGPIELDIVKSADWLNDEEQPASGDDSDQM
jgi:uncharacterized protein (AIM24 family)